MKIESVSYNGIEEIYTVFRKVGLGARAVNLFNHIEVFIRISELTMMETFFMKQFVSGNLSDIGASLIEGDDDYKRIFPEDIFPEMKPSITSILDMLPTVEKDELVETKPGMMVLPLGAIKREVMVRFNSQGLMVFFQGNFQAIWEQIFTEDDGTVIPVAGRPDKLDLTNEKLKQRFDDFIIKSFVSRFYQFMEHELSPVDEPIDALIYDRYYKYLEGYNDCTISDIHTPVGKISFFGTENVGEEIYKVKSLIKAEGPTVANAISEGIRLNFTCVSSIYTFIELMIALPYGSIIDWSDLNINMITDQVILSRSLERYKSRIINKVKTMNAIKCELATMKDFMPLAKYNFIISSSPVRFNIMVTGDRVAFYEEFLKKINSGYYGRTDLSISKELRLIAENILNISNSMRTALLT